MRRPLKMLGVIGLFLAGAVALGFLAFANSIAGLVPDAAPTADGIVVLTGDEDRITTGMHLMEAGRAGRMLISGVHRATRMPSELKRSLTAARDLIRCCVDIGHEALNTGGNADEARRWALARNYKSLIVVTSSYHLPRSLVEFQRAMPGFRLIGYPAPPGRHLQLKDWWKHRQAAKLLAIEYVKFLGAVARLGIERISGNDDGDAHGAPLPRRPDEAGHTIGAVE
ncbi:MAG: YdcF family protein [Hyphomicrobiaceae bacterium]